MYDEDSSVVSAAIGPVGSWQLRKATLLGIAMIFLAFHSMSYPLLAREREFKCVRNGSAVVQDSQCYVDEQQRCEEWEFPADGVVTLQQDFSLVCHRRHLLSLRQVVFFAGMSTSCLLTGHLSDRFGRRRAMLMLMAAWSAAALAHVAAVDATQFLALQFMLAFASSAAWLAAWIWVMEALAGKWRIIVGLGTFVFWIVGYVGIAVLVKLLPHWRMSWLAMSLPTLVLFPAYYFLIPESPMWLISHGKVEEARTILSAAARSNGMRQLSDKHWKKLLESEEESSRNDTSGGCSLALISAKNVRIRSLILFYLWFTSSLTYFGLSLNSADFVIVDVFISFVSYGIVELPAICLSIVAIVAAGRRLPLLLLLGGASGACVCAALANSKWLSLALAVAGKFCVTCDFYLLHVYTSELYPTPLRHTGLAACSLFARLGGMAAPAVTAMPHLLPLAVFGGCSALAVAAAGFLPETKGARLPQTTEESENFGAGDTAWKRAYLSITAPVPTRQKSVASCATL